MVDARETEKDPDAFRTISEVAEDLNLPQHVLRFWETRFPQIKPVKRAGGRRFYRPEDVDLLRGVRQLLYREGYTIKGVQKILKEQGIRHVQDIGVERDVAVMRSASAEPRAPAQDGVILGGLLGLLPRRKNKGYDDPALDAVPRDVELPLPFPDPEVDRDLEEDRGDPVAPLPPRARSAGAPEPRHAGRFRNEPSLDDTRFYEDSGSEPHDFDSRRPDPRDHAAEPPLADAWPAPHDVFDDDEPEEMPPHVASRPAPLPSGPAPQAARTAQERGTSRTPAPSGSAPSFAPPRSERPEPVARRRPTRGPAARVSTAPLPESEDPLLPFMEDQPRPASAAPLDERIRRLKARESGPPEEYLPPKLRRRPAAGPAEAHSSAQERIPDRSPPVGPATEMSASAWPELARAAAAAEQDLAAWHDHISQPEQADASAWEEDQPLFADAEAPHDGLEADVPFQDPEDWAGESYALPDDAPMPGAEDPQAWADDDSDVWVPESPVTAPAPVFQVRAPVSARLGMGTLGAASGLAGTRRPPPPISREAVMSPPSSPVRQAPSAPQHAAAPRTGASQQRPAPTFQEPPAAPAYEYPVRRVGPLTGPLLDPLEDELPPLFSPGASGAGNDSWNRPPHGGAPRPHSAASTRAPVAGASANPFWQGRGPFDEAVPPAPIDPYLPPHLRAEMPRSVGHHGGVQPVLSRDDVHRLQATLYELGECRRLLADVGASKPETDEA